MHATPDRRLTPIQKWTRDGGEDLRIDRLGLSPDDVVLDFGGYHGDYAAELRRRYDCTVHLFEPVPEFLDGIRARFTGDAKVIVHGVAVSHAAGVLPMRVQADATGAFANGPAVEAPVIPARDLTDQLPRRIALAKVNIEGGEYDLIPALYDAGLLERIDRLFVQFHEVTDTSGQDHRTCQALLERTHSCDWDYPFVWESWTRR